MSDEKPKLCTFCRKKPRKPAFRPFCSSRCRDRDLARWFNDGYALRGEPAYPDDNASQD